MNAAKINREEIRRQMAQIRRSHHADVADMLMTADRVAGLGKQAPLFGWAALLGATVWLLTKLSMRARTEQVKDLAASGDREPEKATERSTTKRSSRLSPFAQQFVRDLGVTALRLAQNVTAHWLEQRISEQRALRARKHELLCQNDTKSHRRMIDGTAIDARDSQFNGQLIGQDFDDGR